MIKIFAKRKPNTQKGNSYKKGPINQWALFVLKPYTFAIKMKALTIKVGAFRFYC